jgi:hypothetical protein
MTVDILRVWRKTGGVEALDAAAKHIICTATAVLAHESGHCRALEVLDGIKALHDPRSPDHWQWQRPARLFHAFLK